MHGNKDSKGDVSKMITGDAMAEVKKLSTVVEAPNISLEGTVKGATPTNITATAKKAVKLAPVPEITAGYEGDALSKRTVKLTMVSEVAAGNNTAEHAVMKSSEVFLQSTMTETTTVTKVLGSTIEKHFDEYNSQCYS
jgi:hypothetical protein